MDAEVLGRERQRLHGHPGHTAYPEDPARAHSIGLRGELLFSQTYGLPVDRTPRPLGDHGIDFRCPMGRISVKTSRRGIDLLVEEDDIIRFGLSEFYVAAWYHEASGVTRLMGWTTGAVVTRAEVIDIKLGPSRRVWYCDLEPMSTFVTVAWLEVP